MSTIQKKSIQSTLIILAGFALGALNLMVIQPKVLTTEQFGLTRVIGDAAVTMATLCTLGCLPIIYKFFPFYKDYLPARKNDLPFVTGMICLAGLIVMLFLGWLAKDIVIRKFSEKSPLFVGYSYLVYPYCFFMLSFMWLESFSISFKKSNLSNALREFAPRILFTCFLGLYAFRIVDDKGFYTLFALSFSLPAVILFFVLRRTGEFLFVPTASSLTRKLRWKMTNFGLFLFGSQFLNLLSKTVDTFILSAKGSRGLTDAAVFTIATYVVTLMEIPQRSMNSVTVPVLAESWKNKNIARIKNIYNKSVTNLLLVGLAMFSLMCLNLDNLGKLLGNDFIGIGSVIFIMGIGKLIDLGTGANSQIIGTSSYWKVDFVTNVIYTLLALPLNYFLIAHFGLIGAAYSNLISLTFYNVLRFGFLWKQFGMQPYTWKDLLSIVLAGILVLLLMHLPVFDNFIVDAVVRSGIFLLAFALCIYLFKISDEAVEMANKYVRFKRPA